MLWFLGVSEKNNGDCKQEEIKEGDKLAKKGYGKMNSCVFTIGDIVRLVKPVAEKYRVKAIYLFGSYARGEADGDSDLDFLVFGGEDFNLTMIFALAEELRGILKKMWMSLKLAKLTKTVIFTIQL